MSNQAKRLPSTPAKKPIIKCFPFQQMIANAQPGPPVLGGPNLPLVPTTAEAFEERFHIGGVCSKMMSAQFAGKSDSILAETGQALLASQVILARLARIFADEQAERQRSLDCIETSRKLLESRLLQ